MYSPLTLVHIIGGIAGLVSGMIALFARKGALLHRQAGNVFVVTMLFMAASGAYIALLKDQPFNVFAGVLTLYLVSSAWLTVKRRAGTVGRGELALLIVALATGLSGIVAGVTATKSAGPYFVFATIALLLAAGDVRMLLRRGISGAQRLTRHLWRMGFGLFVASGSFFLGTAGDPVFRRSGLRARLFTPAVRATHLPQIPVLLVVLITIYWVIRVRYDNRPRALNTERSQS